MTATPLVTGTLIGESFARETGARDRAGQPARRARMQRALRAWWAKTAAAFGPASPARAIHHGAGVPLFRLLGFTPIDVSLRVAPGHVAVLALTRHATRVAIVTTAWNAASHGAWRSAVATATRAGVAWCLVFDGMSIGAVDASRPFARRQVSVTLPVAAGEEAGFDVLWALLRADRFDQARDGSPLDRLVAAAGRQRALTCAALDRGVREACDRLRHALAQAAGRAHHGSGPPVDEQALTVVFRLLFLLYAESRGLLPLHDPIYRDAYSIGSLADGLDRPARRGWWLALRAIMRMAHAGCRVRGLDVAAFNGRLFAPAHAPLAERDGVDDEAARAAVRALTWRIAGDGRRVTVPYGELGVEQLGAIYERLIDGQAPATPRASRRKATGSFYTPVALTHFVVRRTLAPLVEHAKPEDILRLRVLDPAMGSGAFLVAACHYLAAAYERALVASGEARPGDLDDADRAQFRRLLAQRCLYGVDRNPMAVQLARLSLWLTTLARDRPLSFLDHRLRAGDSLVGAGLADLARPSAGAGRRRPRPAVLPLLAMLDPAASLGPGVAGRQALALAPDDDVRIVGEKARLLEDLRGPSGPLHRWALAGDVWCAPWFWPEGTRPGPAVFSDLLTGALRGDGSLRPVLRDPLLARVNEVAARHAFFHWPFEFPEVFWHDTGAPREDAGFDAILGNPPWDMVRAEDGTPREQARQLAGFARDSGLYSHGGDAHVNRYQLFVERALDLLRDGGRLGLIVPWGLFGDAGAAAIRRRLIDRASIDTLVAFDNRHALFPIHRGLRFAACCATKGRPTHAMPCRTGETDTAALDRIPDAGSSREHFPVLALRDTLAALSGEGLAVPAVRDEPSLALLARLASSHPALADPGAWGARFSRELNASDDRPAFVDAWVAATLPAGACPIVEGKHLRPFQVAVDDARWWLPPEAAARRGRRFATPRLAFRDVAGAGNRLTLIAAILPAGSASVHTVFCLESPLDDAAQLVLCALLNSLVANWYVRHWVSTHVTTGLVARLPAPWLHPDDARFARLLALARRCTREGEHGPAWVEAQAEAARAYGLSGAELAAVLASFPLIEDARRDAVARTFARL